MRKRRNRNFIILYVNVMKKRKKYKRFRLWCRIFGCRR